MAVNGLTGWSTSNFLSVAAAIVTDGSPFGISAWAHDGDDWIAGSIAVSGNTAAGTNHAHRLTTDDGGTRILSANARTVSGGPVVALAADAFAANTWFHGFAAFVAINLREARLNGGSLGTNTNNRDPDAPDIFTIGSRNGGGTPWTAAGGICSVSLWDLTDFDETERTALAAELATLDEGVAPDPRDVDAQVGQPWSGMLLAYWRLADSTDLDDLVGANDLTMNGTLTTFGTASPVGDADEAGGEEVSDSAVASDALTAEAGYEQAVTDGAVASDSATGVAEGGAQEVSDSAVASDSLTGQAAYVQAVSDGATASEDFTVGVFTPGTPEGAVASDSVTGTAATVTSVTDGATASDSPVAEAAYTQDVSDDAVAADNPTGLTGGQAVGTASDSAVASDSVDVQAAVEQLIADTAVASDTITVTQGTQQEVTDGARASDIPAALAAYLATLSDGAVASDEASFAGAVIPIAKYTFGPIEMDRVLGPITMHRILGPQD
jgi:hypothetical protein